MSIKWQKELEIFSDIKTSYVIEGNIYDIYPYEVDGDKCYCELDEYLYYFLKEQGFSNVLFFEPMHGFYNRFEEMNIIEVLSQSGCNMDGLTENYSQYLGNVFTKSVNQQDEKFSMVNWAGEVVNTIMTSDTLCAIVMSFASRYCETPDNLSSDERYSYLNLMYGSMNAHRIMGKTGLKKSAFYLIAEKINDIPSWFFIQNPYFKNITIPLPDNSVREDFINYIIEDFSCISPSHENGVVDKLTHVTEGMKCVEINGLANLCEKEKFEIQDVGDAVSLYKYGIKDNPWQMIPKEVLDSAEEKIKERVKGQDAAVTRVVDIIKRAASGMSGLQHSASKARPRGIMFFAGPTGVGKTELAKALSELLFNDEANCIRFDMSEYAQEQADQKLFGAPPGYVGYEAGGQLTNAVRNHPFSILLFDEIEKAHPSIWDKFLQVLDDGRMTDGQGNTVYFSETLIVFTSNLGIYVNDEFGRKVKNVSIEDSYESLEEKVMFGIKDYFNSQHGKPEILNRIGNNVIVFQYITKESAYKILMKQLGEVSKYLLEEKNIQLVLDECVEKLLDIAMVNIENGGRGIGNIVEEYMISPLARVLYGIEGSVARRMTIYDFKKKNGVVSFDYILEDMQLS